MIMKHAQKVKKRYLTILNDMAKNRDSYVKNPEKDFTRKRKLSFQDTINTVSYTHLTLPTTPYV